LPLVGEISKQRKKEEGEKEKRKKNKNKKFKKEILLKNYPCHC